MGAAEKRGCQVVVGLAGKDARRMDRDLRVAKTSRIRFTTTRHAASLRPLRNGRIGFKPPYSKRETAAKGPYGANLF